MAAEELGKGIEDYKIVEYNKIVKVRLGGGVKWLR